MKFKIHKTSNWWFYKDIEINSIEDLLNIVKENKMPLIIYYDKDWRTLEIYNDYRE